jgi:hypothetical protein
VDSVSPTSWLDLEKRVTRLEKLFNPNLLWNPRWKKKLN